MSTTTNQQWVTIPEAAEQLQVSINTIRRMLANGDLKAYKVGKRLVRIEAASLTRPGKPIAWQGK